MAIRSFLSERRLVEKAGRRFLVGPPTCETVVLATSLFAVEISALWARREQIAAAGVDPLAVAFSQFMDPPRAARVLASCIELAGADRMEAESILAGDRDLCSRLVRIMLSLCDASAITASFDLETAGPAGAADAQDDATPSAPANGLPAPSALERIVDEVARRYRVADPRTVMSWPYEMVLSCMALITEDLRGAAAAASGSAGTGAGRSLDDAAEDLSRLGVHVSTGGARG